MEYLKSDRLSALETASLILLLVLIPVQALTARTQLSPTVDESSKLGSGYAILTAGNFRTNLEHPPLGKVIPALGLIFTKERVPDDIEDWTQAFVFPHHLVKLGEEDIDKVFFWGTVPVALIGTLLGLTVFLWSRSMFGKRAAFVSLWLIVFNPAIISLSGVVNNDITATTFILIALFSIWRLARRPTRRTLVLACLAFGLAQISKFTALILVPISVALLLWPVLHVHCSTKGNRTDPAARKQAFRKALLDRIYQLFWLFSSGALIIWAGFAFQAKRFGTLARAEGISTWLIGHGTPESFIEWLWNVPIPASQYFTGFLALFGHIKGGHGAFLAGEVSQYGWWLYFPLAFLLKTPVPTLLVFITGLILSSVLYRREWHRKEFFLLVPLAFYGLSLMSATINIGYRHLLPVLPLLAILSGRIVTAWEDGTCRRLITVALPATLLWSTFETLRIWPDYLSYFNQFAGGSSNGYRWLVDSNYDWGQDLRRLRDYVEKHQVKDLYLSYYGTVDPAFYGIDFKPLSGRGPGPFLKCPPEDPSRLEPGTYVISASQLQSGREGDPDCYDWFRKRGFDDRIGYTLFVYRVNEEDIPAAPEDR